MKLRFCGVVMAACGIATWAGCADTSPPASPPSTSPARSSAVPPLPARSAVPAAPTVSATPAATDPASGAPPALSSATPEAEKIDLERQIVFKVKGLT